MARQRVTFSQQQVSDLCIVPVFRLMRENEGRATAATETCVLCHIRQTEMSDFSSLQLHLFNTFHGQKTLAIQFVIEGGSRVKVMR